MALLPEDRKCRPGALDNPFRRWLFPARGELTVLGPGPGMSVADLGTGVGYFLPELAERVGPAGHLIASDPDDRNLSVARRKPVGSVRVEFLLGTSAQLPGVPRASVDRVLLSLVLCCLVDKEGVMAEAWRILRPGGRALVTFPRGWDLRRGGRRRLRVSPDRWQALLRQHPWRILQGSRGWIIHRYLLEKPAERVDDSMGSSQG